MAKTPTSAGTYELVRRLAAGGMGEIFVARKKGAGRFEKDVALKLLLPHLTASEDSVRRFYDEASLAARMRHPNIVEIFDVGEAEGRPFIAMQLVDGVSLDRYLFAMQARNEQVPLPIARAIGLAICEALAYAHGLTDARGRPLKLVHRDVTPSNVLLSFTGAVQLTDFGIARVGDDKTSSGLRGKAAYVAPEQLTHEAPVDARVDLYAAALTLYELIAGKNPFRRSSKEATLTAVMNEPPAELASVRSGVSAQMSAAVMKALSRRPSARFEDATSFRKAFVDGPVASGPEIAEHLNKVTGGPTTHVPGDEGPSTRSQVIRVTKIVSGDVGVRSEPNGASSAEVVSAPHPDPLGRTDRQTIPLVRWPVMLGVVVLLVVVLGTVALVQSRTTPELVTVTVSPSVVPESPVNEPLKPVNVSEPEPTREVDKPTAPHIEPRPPEPKEPSPGKSNRPKVAKSEPKPVEPSEPSIGYLAADAEPWAEVLVDGARVDRTPFSKYPLPAGKHELVFRGPDGREEKRQVILSQGRTTSVRVTFASP